MDFREQLHQAVESLADHPRRVIASSLGVFWGAAAIVLLTAWGSGFREYMWKELASFGRGAVFMVPARTSSGYPGFRKGVSVAISRDDAAVAQLGHPALIEAILPEHMSDERLLVEAEGRVRRLDMNASDARYAYYRKFEMGAGRFFDASDVAHARAVAVLGHHAAEALFDAPELALGKRIRVSGQPFEVVGVAAEKGRQYMNTNRPDNGLLMGPVTSAEEHLGYPEESISRLLLYTHPAVDADRARRAALATLGPRAGFHPEDEDAVRHYDMSRSLSLIDLFYEGFMVFIGVAGTITLLIGGVGIANYHLAILSERAVEIAVAKSIGARDRVLIVQTVLESLLVSTGSAGLGILLGLAGCWALGQLPPPFPAPILSRVSVMVTFFAVLGVGVVAALVPALRVRRMEITAALRAGL